MFKKIFLSGIKIYQIFISPLLGKNCRFWPSCSEYTVQSIGKYGFKKGCLLSLKRILKCYPWHPGGIDFP